VVPLREGGSLPAVVEADDDGLYVLKFRGAGQGPRALVAELVAGEVGRILGLPVPEIVLIELDPKIGDAEPDPEIKDLIRASSGLNLGLDFLPGALAFSPAVGPIPNPELAADIVWFDALVTNPDRTPQNPNIIVWHGSIWLIDHGASLFIHHTWRDREAHARRSFGRIRDHVLRQFAGPIGDADARQAGRLTEAALESIVKTIPDEWLPDEPTIGRPAAQRDAYVEYLVQRLTPPRPFVEEADGVSA
jgi:hypothetical protein